MNIGLVHHDAGVRASLRCHIADVVGARVLWEAGASEEALARNARQPVHLLLLEIPGTHADAIGTIRGLRAASATAVLLVTDDIAAHAAQVFDAIGCGAADVLELPRAAATLVTKLRSVAALLGLVHVPERRVGVPLVAIGASAGGPAALSTILHSLPAALAGAFVIVQHIDAGFAAGMADWLGQSAALEVRLARDGEAPAAGVALLAGVRDHHLVLDPRQRLRYQDEPSQLGDRPSIDELFDSIARHWQRPAIGVLLTGMGRDGARGLRALRDRGHHTIAQDAASSAIYGMPKAAVGLNAAVEVMPLEDIAGRIQQLLQPPQRNPQ